MRPRASLTAAVASVGLALATLRSGGEPSLPNVLLITVDTLRADALGAYGAAGARTPHSDRLAREGLAFDNAACPMPMTRPSHFSMLTSRYPREHGVVNNHTRLAAAERTLAEILKEAGYRTAAFTGVALLAADSGAAQGFDTFEAPEEASDRAGEVVSKAIRWLQGQVAQAPFFLWLHLFDPHMPYAPPAPYRDAAGRPPAHALTEFDWSDLLAVARASGGDLPRSVLDYGRALYAGEVAFTDSWIGRLLEVLDARRLTDRTAIVLTADHGECFDHGIFFEHSQCLYEGAVRVPLILRYPPAIRPGRREPRQVSSLDIAPTVLALAALPAPAAFRGHSLLKAGPADGPVFVQHPLFQEGVQQGRGRRTDTIKSVAGMPMRPVRWQEDQLAVRTPEWKYVASGSRAVELYDLRADPAEAVELSASRPDIARALDRRLREWMAANPLNLAEGSNVNAEMREVLRTLGYVH